MKQGIIFDLDGTLWEVTNTTYNSVNEIAKKHNLDEVKIETIRSVFGCNKEESAKLYFPSLPLEEALKLTDEIAIINIHNLKKYGGNIYEGLESSLKNLKEKYDLFIVSNTDNKEYIEAFLKTSGLNNYFKDYIAASELKISKAEAIKKIIRNHNLSESIYVGDTIKDYEATKLAGIPFIYAKYGFGKDLKTTYCINSITDLPSIVEKVLR